MSTFCPTRYVHWRLVAGEPSVGHIANQADFVYVRQADNTDGRYDNPTYAWRGDTRYR